MATNRWRTKEWYGWWYTENDGAWEYLPAISIDNSLQDNGYPRLKVVETWLTIDEGKGKGKCKGKGKGRGTQEGEGESEEGDGGLEGSREGAGQGNQRPQEVTGRGFQGPEGEGSHPEGAPGG